MQRQRIGAVFVNFHCADKITVRAQRLLEAEISVVVVDNSGEYHGPGTVLRPGANLGFGPACNRGVGSLPAHIDTLCLHNPDVDPTIDDVLRLGRRLSQLHKAGAVAPTLRTPRGLVIGGYHEPHLLREVGLATQRLVAAVRSPRPSGFTRGGRRPVATPGPRFGSAALLVVSRPAFDAVGGFDERFPLYGEDLDLWYRLRVSGCDMVFEPSVVVDHGQAAGSPTDHGTRELLRMAGVQLFVQLHRGRRWKPYRWLHRVATCRASAERAGPAGQMIVRAWDAGEPPLAVSQRLREAFLDGVMEAA